MSLHLVAVEEQKVFITNGDVDIQVPDDGNTYTAASAIYAGTLMRLSEVENTDLEPGNYSVMLVAVITKSPEINIVEGVEAEDNQLTLPLEE